MKNSILFFLCFFAFNLSAQLFEYHSISTNIGSMYDLEPLDLDGDGDIDIVTGTSTNLTSFINDGNQNFTEDIIFDERVNNFVAIDFDQDGDIDFISASRLTTDLFWHENDGNQNYTQHSISTQVDGPSSVSVADIDGDGDLDVAATGFDDQKLYWFENDGTQSSFTSHVVATSLYQSNSCYAVDMDEDGDTDLVANTFNGSTYWYENDGNSNFSSHLIASGVTYITSMLVQDIDNDTDLDIVVTTGQDGILAYFKNDGSENFGIYDVTFNFEPMTEAVSYDFDGDGDFDLLSAHRAFFANERGVYWHRNAGNDEFTSQKIIDTDGKPYGMHTTDMNADGRTDLVIGFSQDGEIAWYERLENDDEDFDGYPVEEDCDDNNPLVNPGATEIPNNGIDDNCDGEEYTLEPFGSNWCYARTYATQDDYEFWTGGVITSSGLLFAVSQFDDLKVYDLDNNYITGWAIDGTPISLVKDSEENLYVGINGGDNLVEKYDQEGNLLQGFEKFGEANDIHIDENFDVYVANQCVDEVNVFSATGELLATWEVAEPVVITEGPDNLIYITTNNGNINKYTKEGVFVSVWNVSNTSPNGLNAGLKYNPTDNLFYFLRSIGSTNKLHIYEPDGTLVQTITFPLSILGWGYSISFAPNNALVITDWSNNFSSDGEGIVLYERSSLFIEMNLTNIGCEGPETGSINPELVLGCGNLTYSLSPDLPYDQLTAGDYTLSVSFPDGTTETRDFTIEDQADGLEISTSITDASTGANDGSIIIDLPASDGPYTYIWDNANNSTSAAISNLPPGTYSITVENSTGCIEMYSYTVGGLGSDADNDGFYYLDDCDDNNASINPGQTEVPNNDTDENCDGTALIIDEDEDGFNSDEDCDDNNPAINSDATEIPNNDTDEDCDGTALIIDEDNDGFNSDEDCDDNNPAINPAAEEITNNGIDEDCDGMDLASSLHEIAGNSLQLFPNPIQDDLVLEFTGNTVAVFHIRLFNSEGKLLNSYQMNNASIKRIDFSPFSAGLYFLEITDQNTGDRIVEKVERIH